MEPYGESRRTPRAATPPSAAQIRALERKNGFPMQNGTKKPSLHLHNVYKGCERKSEIRPGIAIQVGGAGGAGTPEERLASLPCGKWRSSLSY